MTSAIWSFGCFWSTNCLAAAFAWSSLPFVFIDPDTSMASTTPTGTDVFDSGTTLIFGTSRPFSRRVKPARSGGGPLTMAEIDTCGNLVVSTLRMTTLLAAKAGAAANSVTVATTTASRARFTSTWSALRRRWAGTTPPAA